VIARSGFAGPRSNAQGCGEVIERFGQGSQPDIAIARFAEGSQPDIAIARFPQGAQPDVAITHLAGGVHPTPPTRVAQPYLEYISQPRASDSQPELQHVAVDVQRVRPARRHGRHARTAIIRRAGATGAQMFAMTVVIPALVGIVVGLAALI
jgi:hypothetical protein